MLTPAVLESTAPSAAAAALEHLEPHLRAFAEYLPRVAHEPSDRFERRLHADLGHIVAMAADFPEQQPMLAATLFGLCSEQLDAGVMHRHSRHKPLGYAGDYQVIDWIYTRRRDSAGVGRLWDGVFHRLAAAEAVRNRKDYFGRTFARLCGSAGRGITVLNLASGPCRDVSEAIARAGSSARGSLVHCVDRDGRAVRYAQEQVARWTSQVDFRWDVKNVFRARPTGHYDLVWSAGLFDYLPDRLAVALLRKMWQWTKAGGSLIVGNIHSRNPTRDYMEWLLDWKLIHRTEADMGRLLGAAGVAAAGVRFEAEPLGVFFFALATKRA